MENKLLPKFRGIKEIILFEVVVAEGKGIEEDPVREVHYFCDKTGKIRFVEDPEFIKPVMINSEILRLSRGDLTEEEEKELREIDH